MKWTRSKTQDRLRSSTDLIGDKPIRIATTVVKPDGTRGLGTQLGGPAREAFTEGRDYDGLTSLPDGSWVIGHYEIVRDR